MQHKRTWCPRSEASSRTREKPRRSRIGAALAVWPRKPRSSLKNSPVHFSSLFSSNVFLLGEAIALELARAGLRVAVFDRQHPGQEASWASAGILSPAPENPGMVAMVPLGKASLAFYPEFVGWIEEISGKKTGFRPKGTLEALFSEDTKAELSTIIALHHGLGLKAEPLRAEDARELEPALSEEVE